jgi:beta-1,2-mannobiose phosphorylase / 1,2-beta-oligomannan phosphorylase
MHVIRCEQNPIITPASVRPSQPDFKVEGSFNAGVVDVDGQTLMLLRVAESVRSDDPNEVRVPVMVQEGDGLVLQRLSFYRDDPLYDFSDPRTVVFKADRSRLYLTSMSHIRIARSVNGIDFTVDDRPFIQPSHRYELYGCEDPRVVQLDGAYYINYSSVSDLGICTSLIRTLDFCHTEALGVIFAPDNRDVCLFPETIGGRYWALHRPAPAHFGSPGIWLASSPDLLHWGQHSSLLQASAQGWDQRKVGGGAPMLKTDKGWLQIYHGVDQAQRYCLGALLLSLDDPRQTIARLPLPLMEPTAPCEREGFFGQVVFTCGALIRGDTLHIYYGAADETMCLATLPLQALWAGLGV